METMDNTQTNTSLNTYRLYAFIFSGSRYTLVREHQNPVESGFKGHEVRETRQEVQRVDVANLLVALGKIYYALR